jgi:hypothetical protein
MVSPADETGEGSAMPQTLKEQLDAAIADAEGKAEADPDAYRGSDWWQLSDAEEAVFEIDRDRWPRMMTVFHCYEGFKRMTDSPEWDDALIELSRQQRPGWCGQAPSNGEFSHFAQAFGGLTNREAHAAYTKQEFWTVRLGVTVYADESPAS